MKSRQESSGAEREQGRRRGGKPPWLTEAEQKPLSIPRSRTRLATPQLSRALAECPWASPCWSLSPRGQQPRSHCAAEAGPLGRN